MRKLAVIGTIIVQPGTRGDVVQAVLDHRERCLREEAGLLAFEVLVSAEDDAKLLLYELFADGSALAAHMQGASIARLQTEIGSKVVSLTGVQCALATEAVRSRAGPLSVRT